MRLSWIAGVATALLLGVAGAHGQWGQRKGEGALVIRDGAPAYESKSSTTVKRTFSRGDAVAGFHKVAIAVNYEFFEENGRVRVLYPRPNSARMDDAWMDPADLQTFIYDCCDEECIPVKASFKRAEWNPCFKEGMNRAVAHQQFQGRHTPRPSAGRTSSSAKEPPLTNDDVLAMLGADLGDELVIAKIRQAQDEALDVSPEALVALRRQGVSKAVLDAMLSRAGQP